MVVPQPDGRNQLGLSLPPEIFTKIFSLTSRGDRCRSSRVCTYWHQTIHAMARSHITQAILKDGLNRYQLMKIGFADCTYDGTCQCIEIAFDRNFIPGSRRPLGLLIKDWCFELAAGPAWSPNENRGELFLFNPGFANYQNCFLFLHSRKKFYAELPRRYQKKSPLSYPLVRMCGCENLVCSVEKYETRYIPAEDREASQAAGASAGHSFELGCNYYNNMELVFGVSLPHDIRILDRVDCSLLEEVNMFTDFAKDWGGEPARKATTFISGLSASRSFLAVSMAQDVFSSNRSTFVVIFKIKPLEERVDGQKVLEYFAKVSLGGFDMSGRNSWGFALSCVHINDRWALNVLTGLRQDTRNKLVIEVRDLKDLNNRPAWHICDAFHGNNNMIQLSQEGGDSRNLAVLLNDFTSGVGPVLKIYNVETTTLLKSHQLEHLSQMALYSEPFFFLGPWFNGDVSLLFIGRKPQPPSSSAAGMITPWVLELEAQLWLFDPDSPVPSEEITRIPLLQDDRALLRHLFRQGDSRDASLDRCTQGATFFIDLDGIVLVGPDAILRLEFQHQQQSWLFRTRL